MPRVIKEMAIKEARIEEILEFKSMQSLEKYITKQMGKILYDINFGFGIDSKSYWSETYTSTAVRYTNGDELLLHICFPYNSMKLDKKGMLCANE